MAWSIFSQGGGPGAAEQWADDLLKMEHLPETPGNVQFVYDWEVSEGGGGKFNPLNQGPVPGHPELTSTGPQYGGGAADFVSWQAGLEGASDYLAMPAYSAIVTDLSQDNQAQAEQDLWASPWASSHYGYGSAWSSAAVPGYTTALSTPVDVNSNPTGGGQPATLTSFNPLNPFSWGSLFSADNLERLGLILLGGVLIVIGIFILAGKGSVKVALSAIAPEASAASSASKKVGSSAANSQGT